MSETIIYTKPGCPYCAAAMDDYRSRGEPFRQVDVAGDPKARETFRKLSPELRVPTIVKPDGQVQIGFGGA